MPRARVLLAGILGLIVLLLLAVWQVPSWLDWTRYRTTIEVLASATLGQQVTIEGPIALTLLPQPLLTASKVNVGGDETVSPSIHVGALRLRVALWPLLSGRVDARELVLHEPDLRIPWRDEPGVLRVQPPSWLAAFRARIEDGRLTLGRLTFTGIDATLATLDTGALSASGTARFSNHSWNFTARLTAAGADGAAGLDVTLDGQGQANGLGANFSGQLAADGSLAGSIASRGPDLSVLLPAPAVPFRADGRLTVGNGLAAIDDLALELGGSPATAAVALRVAPQQRLDIAVAASRLDLEAWLPVLLHGDTTVAGISVPIGVDLSAEAAPLGNGTLQHVRAAFELLTNDLIIREASAVLPGNASLRVNGRVARAGPGQPQLDCSVSLDAPVLRTTLGWLNDAAPKIGVTNLLSRLPSGVLQKASLSTEIVTGDGAISLRNIAGQVDETAIAGSVVAKPGEPPAIIADLTLDRLSLDVWLPNRLPTATEISHFTAGLNADMRLTVQQATFAGQTMHDVSFDASADSGNLIVRRFATTAAGVSAMASGNLGETGRLTDGKLSLSTQDAGPLVNLVPAAWRATPALWHGAASVDVQAAGPPEALVLQIRLAMADARLEAQPKIDTQSGAWSGPITLRHPGARRLIATLGLPDRLGLEGLPVWLGDGSLSLTTRVTTTAGRFTADSFDLTAGSLRTNGNLALDMSGTEPHLTGRVSVDSLPLPIASGVSNAPLPFALLRGWQAMVQLDVAHAFADLQPELRDAKATLSLDQGVLHVDQVSGKLAGGTVAGAGIIDSHANPPTVSLQASVQNAAIDNPSSEMPLDLISGHAEGNLDLNANGYSLTAILATLSGHATLAVTDGALSGFELFRLKQAAAAFNRPNADSTAPAALTSGITSFDRLDLAANVDRGMMTIDTARLSGGAGEAVMTGGVALANQRVDLRIVLRPAIPEPPDVAIHIAGPIDHPNRTIELAGLARWVAEHAQ